MLKLYNEVLYKTPAEIEVWLRERTCKPLKQAFLRWLVLDAIFDRQAGLCAACGQGLGAAVNFDLDHRTARSRGGLNTMDNLQLLHVACHRKKTKAERIAPAPKPSANQSARLRGGFGR